MSEDMSMCESWVEDKNSVGLGQVDYLNNQQLGQPVNAMIDVRACNKPVERLGFRGVRSSKFRHVYGVPSRRELCFENINITCNAHDSNFCAVNPKFVAVVTEVAGGGIFLVLPVKKTGRVDSFTSRVTGHRGPVLDIKWNPFNDNVIASSSDDCTIKLWHIPDEGLVSPLTDWLVELRGHKRRVGQLEWHPTAENILVSAGADRLLIVWDVESGQAVSAIDCHPDVIHSLSFNRDGSLLATTCKDKHLRVIEPRKGIVLSEGVCHEGPKASKVVFLGNTGRLLTTGFSRRSDRQIGIWSQSRLDAPLCMETLDCSSGVVFPYYDHDTKVVYVAGKGDGNIRYYEVSDRAPWLHYLGQYLSGSPQRGLGFMPKRGCDVMRCEIFRFYKLHTTGGLCEPISMIVPRKSELFQHDLYPDTAAARPALSASDWLSGIDRSPVLMAVETGIVATTPDPPKPRVSIPANNNQYSKKLAFLAEETIPDYRPKDLSEKLHKTCANRSTQLQNKFTNKTIEEIAKQFPDEISLRTAYLRQTDEIQLLRQQLANRERRLRDVEEQLLKLRLVK